MTVRWRARLLIQIPGNKLTDNMVADATYSSPTREGAISGILPYAMTMTDSDTEKFKIIVERYVIDGLQEPTKD